MNKFLLVFISAVLICGNSCSQTYKVDIEIREYAINSDKESDTLSLESDTNYYIDVSSNIPKRFYFVEPKIAGDFMVLLENGLNPDTIFFGFYKRLDQQIVEPIISSLLSETYNGAIIIISEMKIINKQYGKFMKQIQVRAYVGDIDEIGYFHIPFEGSNDFIFKEKGSIHMGQAFNFIYEL